MDVQFDESTGIYRRWHRRASKPEDMRALLSAFTQAHNDGHFYRLDDTEAAIEHVLSAEHPGGHTKGERCRVEFVRDVKSARALCRSIRLLLDDGDAEGAVNEGMLLGMALERASVRAHEANAGRGAKVLASARIGHRAVHGSDDAKRTRWAKCLRDWNAVRVGHPGLPKTLIDKLVGEQNHCSPKTIQRIRLKKT